MEQQLGLFDIAGCRCCVSITNIKIARSIGICAPYIFVFVLLSKWVKLRVSKFVKERSKEPGKLYVFFAISSSQWNINQAISINISINDINNSSIIMSNCRILIVLSCLSVVQAWSTFSLSTGQRLQSLQASPHSALHASPSPADADAVPNPMLTRRQVGGWSAGLLSAALVTTVVNPVEPAVAKEEVLPPSTPAEIQQALQLIRDEFSSPDGGIPYLQKLIDAEDYPTIMAFTPQYDLKMRKLNMGKAAKVMAGVYATESEKEQKKAFSTTATLAKNAVTFDLIGINRASRPGQEDKEKAQKYLQELKDDMQKFLDLEKTLQRS
jgi:hypothetical protein